MAVDSRARFRAAVLIVALAGTVPAVCAADVAVAAAADLGFALKEIVAEFEQASGHHVRLTLGSSGNLYAQIRAGAPFDLFLSADVGHARRLEAAGIGERGSTFVYGTGQLVLWVPNTSRLDLDRLGMQVLAEPSVRRIAIANPQHAPYGRAAVAALEKLGLYAALRAKLVLGENVSQAAQFVQTGAADVGIIARGLAAAPAMLKAGRMQLVPAELYPPLEQAGVVVRRRRSAATLDAARALMVWLRGPRGRAVLDRYGFMMPAGAGTP